MMKNQEKSDWKKESSSPKRFSSENKEKKSSRKLIYTVISLFLVIFTAGFFVFYNADFYQSKPAKIGLNTNPISKNEISEIKMQKIIYEDIDNGKVAKFVDVKLNDADIVELIRLLNSVDGEEKVRKVPAEIKAGVVMKLKQNGEIRVQYNSDGVFVTHITKNKTEFYKLESTPFRQYFQDRL